MEKTKRSAVDLIKAYNLTRNAEILKFKYEAMAESAFRFLRGTAHLFYHDYVHLNAVTEDKTSAWICGDMHLENFGAYKGDNGLVYFDLNDFDESTRAPLTWDLARFVVSLQVSNESTKLDRKDTDVLVHNFLNTFQKVLQSGKSRTLEQDTVKGVIGGFFAQVESRSRKAFIAGKTLEQKGKLKLLKNKDRWLKLDKDHSVVVLDAMEQWNKTLSEEKQYSFEDIAYRLAGTGSLGLERYVVLAKNAGHYYFLDVKRAQVASINELVKPVITWANDAERIIESQKMTQHVSPALLNTIFIQENAYVIKDLQPEEDKLDFTLLKSKREKISEVIGSMAEMAASAYLRSSGWKGSTTIDGLMAFATKDEWKKELFDFSREYRTQVSDDYKEFMAAYKSGSLIEKHQVLAVDQA